MSVSGWLYFVILVLTMFPPVTLPGQVNQYMAHEDSDPDAVELLDKLRTFLAEDRLFLSFSVTFTAPGEEPYLQKGTAHQQGNMYRIKTRDSEIWCDGETRWVYVGDVNEVGMYSVDENASSGPVGLFEEYTGQEYVAGISGMQDFEGTEGILIELKPVERQSIISKVRIALTGEGKPLEMIVFEKTATRTTLTIIDADTPEKKEISYFKFDPAQYPDVHIEDLRID